MGGSTLTWRLYGSREPLSLDITVNRSSVTRISNTHAQMHKCAIQYTSYNTVHMLVVSLYCTHAGYTTCAAVVAASRTHCGCGLVGLLSRSPLPFSSLEAAITAAHVVVHVYCETHLSLCLTPVSLCSLCVPKCVCVRVRVRVYVRACIRVCVHAYVRACLHLSVHTCMCIHIL